MNPSARSKTRWKLPYLRNELLKYTSRKLPLPFIAVTETWLKSYITDAMDTGQIDIEHYNVSRSDRSTRIGRGGGVLLYSHESVPITDVQKYEDQFCQSLICKCESSKLIICVLYRPPNASLQSFKSCLEFIETYIKFYDDYYDLHNMLGDLNLPSINRNTNMITCSDSIQSAEFLLSFMADNLCSQFVLEPTRADNILDLNACSSAQSIDHVHVTDTRLSDHRLAACRSIPSVSIHANQLQLLPHNLKIFHSVPWTSLKQIMLN